MNSMYKYVIYKEKFINVVKISKRLFQKYI